MSRTSADPVVEEFAELVAEGARVLRQPLVRAFLKEVSEGHA
jgi:hypothetical protein